MKIRVIIDSTSGDNERTYFDMDISDDPLFFTPILKFFAYFCSESKEAAITSEQPEVSFYRILPCSDGGYHLLDADDECLSCGQLSEVMEQLN